MTTSGREFHGFTTRMAKLNFLMPYRDCCVCNFNERPLVFLLSVHFSIPSHTSVITQDRESSPAKDRWSTSVPRNQCRHGQDKTVLSCPCRWCEHNWWQDKTQFPIFNCSVSNILIITENLEMGNWVETKQNCLVANSARIANANKTTALSCPCWWCEQAIRVPSSEATI